MIYVNVSGLFEAAGNAGFDGGCAGGQRANDQVFEGIISQAPGPFAGDSFAIAVCEASAVASTPAPASCRKKVGPSTHKREHKSSKIEVFSWRSPQTKHPNAVLNLVRCAHAVAEGNRVPRHHLDARSRRIFWVFL